MSFGKVPPAKTLLARHRILSPLASIKVSPLCLGTMNFGETWNALMGKCNKETTFPILDHFYSCGGNFIDTANIYMAGESESWLGEWMALRDVRDEMVVGTKYSIPLKGVDKEKIFSNHGGNNKKSLRIALDGSLKRLGTEYVDILYVHGWEGMTSIEELMRSLDDVVQAGKALYLGISNTPAWVVVKANAYARAHALSPFVVFEGRWNAADRDIEREIVPMCKAEGMAITVWSAMGGGRFKNAEEQGRNSAAHHQTNPSVEVLQSVFKQLRIVGERKSASATNIALKYVMLKAPYVFPICGGRTVAQLQSNIDALSVDLSDAEIEEIESVCPFDLGYPHSMISGPSDKQMSAKQPALVVAMCCNFDSVEEIKAIRPQCAARGLWDIMTLRWGMEY